MPIRFAFTETQSKNFSSLFEQIQSEYFYIFGADIMPSIRRLGVITFRIAMILSVLRILEHGLSTNVITCSDTDYSTAITIIKTLLQHTAKVFQTLPENNVEPIQGSKNQLKQQLFDTLPHDFDTQTAYMKLLFPHWTRKEDVDIDEFETYCLLPAIRRRGIIKEQCHNIDPEFKIQMPRIEIKKFD